MRTVSIMAAVWPKSPQRPYETQLSGESDLQVGVNNEPHEKGTADIEGSWLDMALGTVNHYKIEPVEAATPPYVRVVRDGLLDRKSLRLVGRRGD